LTEQLLLGLRAPLSNAGLWDELDTDPSRGGGLQCGHRGDGQPSAVQPFAGDVVQHGEGRGGCCSGAKGRPAGGIGLDALADGRRLRGGIAPWTALVQGDAAHQRAFPQQRAGSAQVRQVDAADGGQVDQIGDQRHGVEGLVRFAEDADVEVARVRFGTGRAAEHGEDPNRVPLAEGVEPARSRASPCAGVLTV